MVPGISVVLCTTVIHTAIQLNNRASISIKRISWKFRKDGTKIYLLIIVFKGILEQCIGSRISNKQSESIVFKLC